MRRGLRRSLAWIAALALIALAIAGGLAAYWYLGPYRNFTDQVFVDVDHGMSSHAIADRLSKDGVIRSPWAFLVVRALHPSATLQAGEYRFAGEETPWQIFNKIRRGETFYENFTVPEGSNLFDIAALLRQGDTVNADEFLKTAADPALIHDLDATAPDLEGYLFPSTYRVTHRTTAVGLCRLMTGEFRKQWTELTAAEKAVDVHRSVTLASIVEKESAIATERPLVAAVYLNRLRLGMPLQCDPTTIYAALLDKRYTGVLHRSDLASANPYNTYMNAGLPPGPIANPGKASLAAALHPANAESLYFVAKGDGSGAHTFSTTLAEHAKAVAEYRARVHAK